jgi:hypothetical protein
MLPDQNEFGLQSGQQLVTFAISAWRFLQASPPAPRHGKKPPAIHQPMVI